MDRFKEISAFVSSVQRGSLSAAAAMEGVTPAVVSRRLDALEARLGVKLMVRTSRRLTLTFEGAAFLEDCQRVLNDLANAEASVSLGGIKASGHIRVSAPAGFGRRHVAPVVMEFLRDNPDVTVSLDLSDRVVDLVNEGIDVAVRLGDLADSSLVSVRLGENRRVVVASPEYLLRWGTPSVPADLVSHHGLALSQQRGWVLLDPERAMTPRTYRVAGVFECNDGAVLREWALAGVGLAWRSMWEVGGDLAAGRLVSVLDDFSAPPVGIHAVFPQRRNIALRVRLFIDRLKHHYCERPEWAAAGVGS
ncbi:LysR family transcriptional regulator [Niveibacterium microcysteis]|uniref:LysR family transcriptional regulator n=1 Tax=Niveibacterium microcysteis TaxID=2811415 RepID=A0ABX7M1I7_9RHOO|nr:LysR family transcriptional regulator [Niveibacterium microcysteis]QSI75638.1 LysR family transcriptional regulator [Niveibacterium microcysteis]